MRDRKAGLHINDGLYMDRTLAFEPRRRLARLVFRSISRTTSSISTGVFDQVIGTLNVKGQKRRVVMTAGKERAVRLSGR